MSHSEDTAVDEDKVMVSFAPVLRGVTLKLSG